MKTLFVILCSVLLFSPMVHARLGENPKQLTERLGAPASAQIINEPTPYEAIWVYNVANLGRTSYVFKQGVVVKIFISTERTLDSDEVRHWGKRLSGLNRLRQGQSPYQHGNGIYFSSYPKSDQKVEVFYDGNILTIANEGYLPKDGKKADKQISPDKL